MKDNNTVRYRSLDIVRGIAALTVVMGHVLSLPIEAPGIFHRAMRILINHLSGLAYGGGMDGGYTGVIVFIVLSGFCIHLPVAEDRSKAWKEGFWRTYARRRFLRIAPVYWFASLFVVLLTRTFLGTMSVLCI